MPRSTSTSPFQLQAVKVCGMTSITDRDLAVDAGADYFGALVDVAFSQRSISLDTARKLFDSPPIPGVALLFNVGLSRVQTIVSVLQPFAIQLIGHETPEFVASLKATLDCQVWKSLYIPPKGHGEIDLEGLGIMAEEFEDSGADALLFSTADTGGSKNLRTGMVGDWGTVRGLLRGRLSPGYIAGGLSPDNISAALQITRPFGVDLCSGVESAPGKKDPKKLVALFEALSVYREADAESQ